ncbi:hypothetical protein PLESTM_001898600 [Pleodorina starrii]|nr:hypothetical protein PLESTM_001898600 [Pleodorina starrii]
MQSPGAALVATAYNAAARNASGDLPEFTYQPTQRAMPASSLPSAGHIFGGPKAHPAVPPSMARGIGRSTAPFPSSLAPQDSMPGRSPEQPSGAHPRDARGHGAQLTPRSGGTSIGGASSGGGTPDRPIIVNPPPSSAQRPPSGLLSHLRSLGDYILPGGAAWRGAAPPRATEQEHQQYQQQHQQRLHQHTRQNPQQQTHQQAHQRQQRPLASGRGVFGSTGRGGASAPRTSQRQGHTASLEDSVGAAAATASGVRSRSADATRGPAADDDTTPRLLTHLGGGRFPGPSPAPRPGLLPDGASGAPALQLQPMLQGGRARASSGPSVASAAAVVAHGTHEGLRTQGFDERSWPVQQQKQGQRQGPPAQVSARGDGAAAASTMAPRRPSDSGPRHAGSEPATTAAAGRGPGGTTPKRSTSGAAAADAPGGATGYVSHFAAVQQEQRSPAAAGSWQRRRTVSRSSGDGAADDDEASGFAASLAGLSEGELQQLREAEAEAAAAVAQVLSGVAVPHHPAFNLLLMLRVRAGGRREEEGEAGVGPETGSEGQLVPGAAKAEGLLAEERRGVEGDAKASSSGSAGHALVFQDHVVVKTDFRDFPTTALTFEAWISTSDFCHAGTVMSYAKDSKAVDDAQRIADFNHFVIFDTRLPSVVERDGRWHHLAVTWTAAEEGLTKIYVDGSLMASARSHRTAPLDPNGAFMLGGEQDCFGGCVDPSQGFHGLMDEVRLWRTALEQEEIVRRMRWASGLEGFPDLVAWWKFDEPNIDPGIFARHTVARDASGRGNDLQLETPPTSRNALIPVPGARDPLRTGALEFRNGMALNKGMQGFPTRSFTVEMWAKGAAVQYLDSLQQKSTQLFSYAAQKTTTDGYQAPGFLDDAVRLERLLASSISRRGGYSGGSTWVDNTAGAVALHVNSNENTDSPGREAVIIFDARWTDDQWHHVAVTWDYDTGVASLYLDGVLRVPFYKSDFGIVDERSPQEGGVAPGLAARTSREATGSLVLGQDQDCMGGCFSPADAFNGQMAVVRVWDRALGQSDVSANMGQVQPPQARRSGLVALWSFSSEGLSVSEDGTPLALDAAGGSSPNHLLLRGNAPLYVYSTAPLAASDGKPLPGPIPGAGGYSLALSDRQVLLLPNFRDFPSSSLTLEFWMTSIDRCRPGVPFSYAVGDYNNGDNAFLLFNYNSWGVSVMEDEGHLSDHQSGVAVTDGLWHHVAVTWDSASGNVRLYDNGREVWQATRGRGKVIPSGGTLVIGREQDCRGGCFDSAAGAAGNISPDMKQEYGVQDFTGVIEEMRLWSTVRSPTDIKQGMDADDGLGPGGFDNPGVDPSSPGLVAYWRFDEGSGYRVRDATGRGHDLVMLQEPQWVVTRWLSSCGNAVVEGVEECDDGDRSDGDGCSSSCRVEPGWVCTGRPRSVCVPKSDVQPNPPSPPPQPPQPIPPPPPPVPPPVQPSTGGGADSSGSGRGPSSADTGRTDSAAAGDGRTVETHRGHWGLVLGLVLGGTALVALVGFALASRHAFPLVLHNSYTALIDKLPLPGGLRARLGPEYNPLVVNPEEMDVSPEFIAATPPRAPPGHPGSYYPLGGTSSLSTDSAPVPVANSPGWLSAPPTPSPVSRSQGTGAGGAV